MQSSLSIRLSCAGIASLGMAVPCLALAELPNDWGFLVTCVGGTLLALLVYVAVVRRPTHALVTGIVLDLIGVGFALPIYKYAFFGYRSGFAVEGILLFLAPPALLVVTIVGAVAQLTGRRPPLNARRRSSPVAPEPPSAPDPGPSVRSPEYGPDSP